MNLQSYTLFELHVLEIKWKCFDLNGHLKKISDGGIRIIFPSDAWNLLDPILSPYGRSGVDFFDCSYAPNFSVREQVPWLIVALGKEYDIADHVREAREREGHIFFSYYSYKSSDDCLPDHRPRVSLIDVMSRESLQDVRNNSPLFSYIWDCVCECAEGRVWLLVLPSLPKEVEDGLASVCA